MNTSDKLFLKLQEMGLKPIDKPKRCRPGFWQRSSGAYSWVCRAEDGVDIGSMYSMGDCLRSKNIEVSDAMEFDRELIVNDPDRKEKKPKKRLSVDHSAMDANVQSIIKKFG
jgi:hypothetical protein